MCWEILASIFEIKCCITLKLSILKMLEPGEVFQNSSSVLPQVHVLLLSPKKQMFSSIFQGFGQICFSWPLLTSLPSNPNTYSLSIMTLGWHKKPLASQNLMALWHRRNETNQIKFELVHTHTQGIIFCQLLRIDCDLYNTTEHSQRLPYLWTEEIQTWCIWSVISPKLQIYSDSYSIIIFDVISWARKPPRYKFSRLSKNQENQAPASHELKKKHFNKF